MAFKQRERQLLVNEGEKKDTEQVNIEQIWKKTNKFSYLWREFWHI